MSKQIIKDLFKLKIDILENLIEHLPPSAKESIIRLQQDFLIALKEAAVESIERKKPEDCDNGIKKVTIE